MEPRPSPARFLRRYLGQGPRPRGADQRVAQPVGRAAGGVGVCRSGAGDRGVRWQLLGVRRVCDRRLVAADASHRPFLDSRVAGDGAVGRHGRLLVLRALVAPGLAGLLVAGLGANFLVAAAGQGNAWFVGLARLRNEPDWIDPWHAYFNTHVTEGRLLAVGDAAVFDLKPPVLYNTCFDDCISSSWSRARRRRRFGRSWRRGRSLTFTSTGARSPATEDLRLHDFVQPEVFDRLVDEGVLEPLPAIEGHPGRAYRVSEEEWVVDSGSRRTCVV